MPPAVVTVTSTVAAACGRRGGSDLGGRDDREGVAAVVPKWTAVAVVNPVPVMVTEVPPAVGPALGATELTVGAAT